MSQFVVKLRRTDNSQPWGMRLKGGTDQGMQLHVEHVQPNGRAVQAGVQVGDLIVGICNVPTYNMTHGQIKSEMLRAGNDLDLVVMRDGSLTGGVVAPPPQAAACAENEPRVVIDEQPICKLGGPTYKKVKPKTYQVLEGQLQNADDSAEVVVQPSHDESVKPASIFDRKKQERSEYLKAKGPTIQKAYGE